MRRRACAFSIVFGAALICGALAFDQAGAERQTETTAPAPAPAPAANTETSAPAPAGTAEELPPYDLPAPPGFVRPQDVCGDSVADWVDVVDVAELNNPRVGEAYVRANAGSTVRFHWFSYTQMIDAILGPNATHDPNTLKLGNAPSQASENGYCTGTLIDIDKVLTARHCFDVHYNDGSGWITPFRQDGRGRTPLPPEELAKLMEVQFDYEIGEDRAMRRVLTYRVAELLEYGGTRRPFSAGATARPDYAIVRLQDNPARPLIARPRARVGTTNLAANDTGVIIQHPNGVPKKIDFGRIAGMAPPYLSYFDIDTDGGSSGAALLDLSGVVRGIHVRGGCNTRHLGNRATPIELIRSVSNIL